ncbi:hypothetical protein FACS1894137_08000 [Spirochaetia bacterium]|nr:hypothetical protein FACS1894137_08000 [Spirochaetia bacterium]
MNRISLRLIPLLLLTLVSGFAFSQNIDNKIHQAVSELTKKYSVKTLAVGEIKLLASELNAGLPDFVKRQIEARAVGVGGDDNYQVKTEYNKDDDSNPLTGNDGFNNVQALIKGKISPLADGSVKVELTLDSTGTTNYLGVGSFIITAEELAFNKMQPKTYRLVPLNNDEGTPDDQKATKRVESKVRTLLNAMGFKPPDSGNPEYIVKVNVKLNAGSSKNELNPYKIQPSVEVKLFTFTSQDDELGNCDHEWESKTSFYEFKEKQFGEATGDIEKYLENNLEKTFRSILAK